MVSNDFDRIVTGYNINKVVTGWFLASPVTPIVLNFAAGPGEFLGLMVARWYSSDAAFHTYAHIDILIDGDIYYTGYLHDLVLGNLNYNFQAHHSSCNIQSSLYSNVTWRVKLPYGTSFQITVTAGAYCDGFVVAHYRHGG